MTNYTELSQGWQALYGLAPDLFIPITDDQTLEQATKALRKLDKEMAASKERPHPLEELANTVMRRIMAYEAEHYPIHETDGASMLGFLIDQHALTQQQLAELVGIPQPTISALLGRRRAFTADHARKLAAHFGVNAGLFLTV